MPLYFVIWDVEPGGNVEHLAEHDVTPEEAEGVVQHPSTREEDREHAG